MKTRAIAACLLRHLLSSCAALAVASASWTTAAQEAATYLSEHKLYNQALVEGNVTAATAHARAAWQAAETELGDHNLTGVLAYNYGQLVLFTDTEEALAALRRANELAEAGIAELPELDLRLYLAYADFAVENGRHRQRRALRQALVAFDATGVLSTPEVAAMWLALARKDLAEEDYDNATESAARAEAVLLSAAPDQYRSIGEAILIGGVARLVPYPRKLEDVEGAHLEFTRAQRLFPPQKDRESFDQVLAQIIAWNAAAGAALMSLGEDEYPAHDDPDHSDNQPTPSFFEGQIEDCGIEWERRRPPSYPARAGYRGYIGAVLVLYDLNDSLEIENAGILSEVPQNAFGEAALRSVKGWRAKSVASDHPSCRKNLLTQFTFTIKE